MVEAENCLGETISQEHERKEQRKINYVTNKYIFPINYQLRSGKSYIAFNNQGWNKIYIIYFVYHS